MVPIFTLYIYRLTLARALNKVALTPGVLAILCPTAANMAQLLTTSTYKRTFKLQTNEHETMPLSQNCETRCPQPLATVHREDENGESRRAVVQGAIDLFKVTPF